MASTLKKQLIALILFGSVISTVAPTTAEAGVAGTLTVVNHAAETREVYYNGIYQGIVLPGSTARFFIGDRSGAPFRLDAVGVVTGYRKFAVLYGNFGNSLWEI